MIDNRIENFARCGTSSVDEWANQFRLDRRMPIARALALLSVCAPETWRPLPKQGYVSTILDFFAKKSLVAYCANRSPACLLENRRRGWI